MHRLYNKIGKNASAFWRELFRDTSGSVAVYSAFAGIMLLGSTALVVDYGRGMVVRHQLQNYADAAAAAGATYLDGGENARARAREVIENTIEKQANLADGAPTLSIANYAFYSSLSPKTPATSDKDAKYISVTVATEQVQYIFAPFIDMLTSTDGEEEIALTAQATASGNPTACAVPPLMVCDYSETLGSGYDLRAPDNVGKQIRLGKASGLNSLAPGNFGILDTPQGSQATQDIAEAMAAVDPEGCYKGDAIDTAPGARVDAIRDGINSRFDMPLPLIISVTPPRMSSITRATRKWRKTCWAMENGMQRNTGHRTIQATLILAICRPNQRVISCICMSWGDLCL